MVAFSSLIPCHPLNNVNLRQNHNHIKRPQNPLSPLPVASKEVQVEEQVLPPSDSDSHLIPHA